MSGRPSMTYAFPLLAGALLVATPLESGAANPDPTVVPTAAAVESMCPDIGLTGLRLGATREMQDQAQLETVRAPLSRLAPFNDGEAHFTSWSGRLAAVTYRRAAAEGVSLLPWQEELVSRLEAAGWTVVADPELSASMESVQLAKRFTIAGEERDLVVDVDAFGLYSVRCGDPALLSLSDLEANGELADGEPRPPAPDTSTDVAAILARLDCDDPAVHASFAGASSLREAGKRLERHLGLPADLNAQANYQTRLGTWLRWRMRGSGKISQEEMWAIEDSARVERAHPAEELGTFMMSVSAIAKANDRKDGPGMCRGYRDLLASQDRISAEERKREAAANRVLEAEARRRGIAVD